MDGQRRPRGPRPPTQRPASTHERRTSTIAPIRLSAVPEADGEEAEMSLEPGRSAPKPAQEPFHIRRYSSMGSLLPPGDGHTSFTRSPSLFRTRGASVSSLSSINSVSSTSSSSSFDSTSSLDSSSSLHRRSHIRRRSRDKPAGPRPPLHPSVVRSFSYLPPASTPSVVAIPPLSDTGSPPSSPISEDGSIDWDAIERMMCSIESSITP